MCPLRMPSGCQVESATSTRHGVCRPGDFHTRHSSRTDGLRLPLRPKGPTSNVCLLHFVKIQSNTLECRTIRTAIMLTLASCYLMWMVTYMAQLHPLISNSLISLLWLYWLMHKFQHHIIQRAERVYDGHALSEHRAGNRRIPLSL
jgi:hypothetical protein